MKRDTLIEHKKIVVVCEESGPISLNYNVLLTIEEANTIVKPVVPIITTKSTLTCTNCDKIGHLVETCHNRKRKVKVVPTATIKSTKLVVGTKTQLVKSGRIHVYCSCIIYFSVEYRFGECPRKIKVQNMFRTKPV
jgi:hypothetical protein